MLGGKYLPSRCCRRSSTYTPPVQNQPVVRHGKRFHREPDRGVRYLIVKKKVVNVLYWQTQRRNVAISDSSLPRPRCLH